MTAASIDARAMQELRKKETLAIRRFIKEEQTNRRGFRGKKGGRWASSSKKKMSIFLLSWGASFPSVVDEIVKQIGKETCLFPAEKKKRSVSANGAKKKNVYGNISITGVK